MTKDLTARDLESRKIATVVERIEETMTQVIRLAKKLVTAAQRRAERSRQVRIKMGQKKARSQLREENRGVQIARL